MVPAGLQPGIGVQEHQPVAGRRPGPGNQLRPAPAAAVTSAERYRQGGYWLRPARNLVCVGLYFLGFPPRLIGSLYE